MHHTSTTSLTDCSCFLQDHHRPKASVGKAEATRISRGYGYKTADGLHVKGVREGVDGREPKIECSQEPYLANPS